MMELTPKMDFKRDQRWSQGIYILANDPVLDWTKACINSIRYYNRELPIYIIPFNGEIKRLRGMADERGLGWYDSPLNPWLEEWGEALFANGTHNDFYVAGFPRHVFRKLTAFWGPLRQFVFLDADTLTLSDINPMFERQKEQDGIYFGDTNGEESNAGVFCASFGLLTPTDLLQTFRELYGIDGLADQHHEQFVLTQCVRRMGLKYGNLLEIFPGAAESVWAGVAIHGTQDGGFFRKDGGGGSLPFLHWAGYRLSVGMPYWETWNHFFQLTVE